MASRKSHIAFRFNVEKLFEGSKSESTLDFDVREVLTVKQASRKWSGFAKDLVRELGVFGSVCTSCMMSTGYISTGWLIGSCPCRSCDGLQSGTASDASMQNGVANGSVSICEVPEQEVRASC